MAKVCIVATNFLKFCRTGSADGVVFVVGVSGFEFSDPRAHSDPNDDSEPKPRGRPFNSFYFMCY